MKLLDHDKAPMAWQAQVMQEMAPALTFRQILPYGYDDENSLLAVTSGSFETTLMIVLKEILSLKYCCGADSRVVGDDRVWVGEIGMMWGWRDWDDVVQQSKGDCGPSETTV